MSGQRLEPAELEYFERWAAHMEQPTPGYSQSIEEDMKDRAQRIRRLIARLRDLEAKEHP